MNGKLEDMNREETKEWIKSMEHVYDNSGYSYQDPKTGKWFIYNEDGSCTPDEEMNRKEEEKKQKAEKEKQERIEKEKADKMQRKLF